MFAPVGYTPLSMLWDQFVDAKIDAVYRSSAQYYASEKFTSQFVRGSALDIAEHAFLGLMWKFWPHAATNDGQVMRVHSRFQDGVAGLFTQISPYRAAYDVAAVQIECGHRDEIDLIAGPTFTEWDFEAEDKDVWRDRYPPMDESMVRMTDYHLGQLNFHTLPVCFERGRFMIVETLPHWAQFVRRNRDQETLVKHLGGRAIVVADEKLEGWDKILSGETPVLADEFSRSDTDQARIGRPPKVQKVADAYSKSYPAGHACSWKEIANRMSDEIGETVSVATVKRAINRLG